MPVKKGGKGREQQKGVLGASPKTQIGERGGMTQNSNRALFQKKLTISPKNLSQSLRGDGPSSKNQAKQLNLREKRGHHRDQRAAIEGKNK